VFRLLAQLKSNSKSKSSSPEELVVSEKSYVSCVSFVFARFLRCF